MDNLEQQIARAVNESLPQTIPAGHLAHLEAKAYDAVRGYLASRGFLPPFLVNNQLTEPELVLAIKWAVTEGDPILVSVTALWLTLNELERVRLKERLELLYPDASMWRP
jgi:hypothetical protein